MPAARGTSSLPARDNARMLPLTTSESFVYPYPLPSSPREIVLKQSGLIWMKFEWGVSERKWTAQHEDRLRGRKLFEDNRSIFQEHLWIKVTLFCCMYTMCDWNKLNFHKILYTLFFKQAPLWISLDLHI